MKVQVTVLTCISLLTVSSLPALAYSDKFMYTGSTSVSYPELTSIGREGVRKKALSTCRNSGGNLIRDVGWSMGLTVIYSYQCFQRT